MKKIISILACVALVVCLIAIPVSAGVEGFTVTVTPADSTLKAGEQTTVTVNLSNAPDGKTSSGVAFSVSEGLEITAGQLNSALPGFSAFLSKVDLSKNKAVVMASDYNGLLVTLTVKVKDDYAGIENQSVNVEVTLNPGEVVSSGSATIAIAHDHVYTAETVADKYLKSAADCTNKAVYYKSCTICGEASTTATFETGEALGHNYVEAVAAKYLKSAADCTHKAVYYKSCSRCGIKNDETFETGEALGHNYNADVTNPNCTEGGYTTHTCSRCNDSYVDSYTTALGHNYVETVDAKYLKSAADCTHKAVYYKSCSRCGIKNDETFEAGEALGHDFVSAWTFDDENHWHACSRCNEISAIAAHTAGEWVVVKEPTTAETGIKHKVCTVCGKELETDEIEKLKEYEVTEGNKSTFKKGGKGVTVTTKVPKDNVTTVKVNGQVVDPANYTVSGETDAVVTLSPEYLATLDGGDYILEVFDEIGVATSTFTVEAPAKTDGSPKTGSSALIWILALLMSNIALAGTIIYRKKAR